MDTTPMPMQNQSETESTGEEEILKLKELENKLAQLDVMEEVENHLFAYSLPLNQNSKDLVF
jgi:hypothetical protein